MYVEVYAMDVANSVLNMYPDVGFSPERMIRKYPL